MTIGQRIAERRKQLGLSQESLGEKMGVSRQAISKWEADGALPEIDKLISLSKLFGVTVGWLLGVEELPEEKDALTEEQLGAMEQLIKLYAAPAQPEKKNGKFPLLSVLALVLSAATLLGCVTYHNNANNSLGSLSYQMMNLQSGYDSVRAQINDLQTAETAPGTPDTLHWFAFQLTPDTEEPKVTVQLSAIPKRHSDETAVFSVRKDGQVVAYAECAWDGTAYVGQQDLPMENGYEYWLVLTDNDGVQQQIPLEDEQAQNLKKTLSLTCEIRENGVLQYQNGELLLCNLAFSLQRPVSLEDGKEFLWNNIELLVVQGGEVTGREILLDETENMEIRRSVCYETEGDIAILLEDVLPENGEGLEIWLKATLSNGMECLEMVGSWRYEGGIFYG